MHLEVKYFYKKISSVLQQFAHKSDINPPIIRYSSVNSTANIDELFP